MKGHDDNADTMNDNVGAVMMIHDWMLDFRT